MSSSSIDPQSATRRSQPAPLARAVVHDRYDLTQVPKHPGVGWTRFVCISDNHSQFFHVPPGDVLLHAGDLCRRGTLRDLEITTDWLKQLPHPTKFFMGGNHDICLDEQYGEGGTLRPYKPHNLNLQTNDIVAARNLVRSSAVRQAGMHYLEYDTATYTAKSGKTYTIYGSPAAPRFHSIGAFQYTHEEARDVYARIPASIDILMTHAPPLGMCDMTKRGQRAGCPTLAQRLIDDDLQSCRLHVCGHIHEARGVAVVGQSAQNPDGRVCVNAALPSARLPIIVDLMD
ncbi:Metallophosphoesterase domain-containing protein 1 [Trametes pubescens]|uniref:Metallophosphoesterase domain-containing protein 1 n=1 Tax=Trametes pubescens TaxID=154538 RepID=A0A1M2V5E6_TRAPU|nr:Metallophosphoesterase domain-containing protein 1 [Trametes pubescens]